MQNPHTTSGFQAFFVFTLCPEPDSSDLLFKKTHESAIIRAAIPIRMADKRTGFLAFELDATGSRKTAWIQRMGPLGSTLLLQILISVIYVLQIFSWKAVATLRESESSLENTVRERTREYETAKIRAEDASRAKSDFIAIMSHEIRTPMNSVIGFTDLIAQTKLDDKQKKFIDTIQLSSNRLMNLLNNLLDLSKLEAGKNVFCAYTFDLQNLVRDMTNTFAMVARKKHLAFSVVMKSKPHNLLIGDQGKIQQILDNLISNAIKFTERGAVTVEVSSAPGHGNKQILLCFRVIDTGSGIPQDRLHLLFNKFTQIDSSTKRKHGGTGLGLSISKHLVELMDGRIGVESQPDRGSCFFFEIPINLPDV